MPNTSLVRALPVVLGAAALLALLGVFFVDDAVARFVSTLPWSRVFHSVALGSPVLVSIACAIVIAGAVQNARGRPLGRLMQVLVVASFSLVWSVCVDEFVLKYIFGRETPGEFLKTGLDSFHWFQGGPMTSFPSGHAVQIMAVGGVFLMAYPQKRLVWFALMGVGLVALVLGNWHFVSDVIAGAAFGFSGGVATFALWHRGERP